MQASVGDLRYRMKDVLRALERRETVTILYHGKVKGTIVPAERDAEPRVTVPRGARQPPFPRVAHRRPSSRRRDER
jgi:antitoxin (DNA-binding transcriptional repressor) of toxin-antitoxin stability system